MNIRIRECLNYDFVTSIPTLLATNLFNLVHNDLKLSATKHDHGEHDAVHGDEEKRADVNCQHLVEVPQLELRRLGWTHWHPARNIRMNTIEKLTLKKKVAKVPLSLRPVSPLIDNIFCEVDKHNMHIIPYNTKNAKLILNTNTM